LETFKLDCAVRADRISEAGFFIRFEDTTGLQIGKNVDREVDAAGREACATTV